MKAKRALTEVSNPTRTLPALVAQALTLTDLIVKAGGELTPELEESLKTNELLIAQKVDGYALVEERLEYEAKYWKDKAARINAIAKGFENARERLKQNLRFSMGELGKTEIKGSEMGFRLQRVQPKLVINEEVLPDEFKMVVQEIRPDKEKIKATLSDGFPVPGASLEESYALRPFEVKGEDDE